MLNEPLKREATVDAKTAEEALALAIRLQQERGEQVTLDQLHKTADEAGIDRECLADALAQVRAQKSAENKLTAAQTADLARTRRMTLTMAIAAAVSMLMVVMMKGAGRYGDTSPAMVVFFVAMIGAIIGVKMRRLRR